MHFIPTSSSWLNLVERWFREITDKRIRRGTFRNVRQLIAAIEEFIDQHNDAPKPVRLDRSSRRNPRQSRPRTGRPR